MQRKELISSLSDIQISKEKIHKKAGDDSLPKISCMKILGLQCRNGDIKKRLTKTRVYLRKKARITQPKTYKIGRYS